jgi:DNA invertase Pin-like site-specific DNA recombinase
MLTVRISSPEQTLGCRAHERFASRPVHADAAADGVSEIAPERAPQTCRPARLTDAERTALLKRSRSGTLAARVVLRSRIVLLAANGFSTSQIARRLGTTATTAALWLRRFDSGGVDALAVDASGRGRKRSIAPGVIDEVRRGRQEGLTVREVARRAGISPASVVRLSGPQASYL